MSFKAKVKLLVPPVVLGLLRRIRRRGIAFTGNYVSWEAASAHATGYSSEEILRRVLAATRKVAAGEAVYERDSVLFDEVEYSWPLLASLLQVAVECGSLRVIDFGGSLGSTWRQNRRYLGRLSIQLAWHVVEQENFVSAGRAEFTDHVLRFEHTIEEASKGGVDAILFCGSLCYVSDALHYIREAAKTEARYLILDRFPVTAGNRDRICVQRVTEPIYPATYPIRFFAEQRLMQYWLSDWQLIERWDCGLQVDTDSRFCGFFMEKR